MSRCESWRWPGWLKKKPGQTPQPTNLVREAYLRLVEVEQSQHWNGRGHYFEAAAEAMRRMLVEKARFEQPWPDKAMLVKLNYFAGLTIPEASEAMGVSTGTAERYWEFARAWAHSKRESSGSGGEIHAVIFSSKKG